MLGRVGPAAAHEEINPSTFPTAKPAFFTLSAANETGADLTKVTLNAPSGVAFGATTRDPTGWTVNRTDQTITWSSGRVIPDRFEQWGFEIEGADQPGTLIYKATLGYADGKSTDVSVEIEAVAASQSASTASTGGSTSTASTALGIAAMALILAIAGLILSSRRSDAPSTPNDAQDW